MTNFQQQKNVAIKVIFVVAITKIKKGKSCLWFDYVESSPILVITNLSCHFLHPPK